MATVSALHPYRPECCGERDGELMQELMTDEMLDEIERRCTAATPGPWESFIEGRDHMSGDSFIRTDGEDIYLIGATHADQDFIAGARQDVPALLREVRALRQALSTS